MIPRLWILRIAMVVGGGLLGPWLVSGLQPPVAMEDPVWEVIAAQLGVSAEYRDDRSTVMLGGALTLGSRDIRRPDRLALRAPGEPALVAVSLAPDSNEVSVRLRDAQTRIRTGHVLVNGEWVEGDGSGRWVLRREQGDWNVDTPGGTQRLAARAGGGESAWLELSSGYSGLGRIQHVRVEDEKGQLLANSDFTSQPRTWSQALAGALIGGLIALCPSVPSLLGVLPLVGVLAVSATTWVAWADRLVLVGTSGWQLGCWVAAASTSLPILWLMSRWGPRHGGISRAAPWPWMAAVLISGVLGARGDLSQPGWLALGFAWLAAPLLFLRRSGVDEIRALCVDGPAMLAVAVFGWAQGFLFAAAWRLGTLLASVSTLRKGSARAGADFALLVILSVPIGMEMALRSGPTGTWWDPAVLRGESEDKGEDWRRASASWSGACGASLNEETIRLAYAGGSATGGAFEFARHPEWFFPVRIHEDLCGDGESRRVETWNYGNTHRDTHTISRTIDLILDQSRADVLVLYVGMNDLLTAEHPKTRAQREQERVERGRVAQQLSELSERSRLLTGLGLGFRAPVTGISHSRVASVGVAGGQRRVQGYPSGVPVEDARANLERIADACAKRGASLVLVSQVLSRDERVLSSLDRSKYFDPYWEMEAQLAAGASHIYFMDSQGLQEAWTDAHLLLDMNHMTRQGNELLAALVLSELKALEVLP